MKRGIDFLVRKSAADHDKFLALGNMLSDAVIAIQESIRVTTATGCGQSQLCGVESG